MIDKVNDCGHRTVPRRLEQARNPQAGEVRVSYCSPRVAGAAPREESPDSEPGGRLPSPSYYRPSLIWPPFCFLVLNKLQLDVAHSCLTAAQW